MLVPERMPSGGGASAGTFFFFGWAAAVCHTVARINIVIRIRRVFIGAPRASCTSNRPAADCVLIALTLSHIKLLPESVVPVPVCTRAIPLAQASTSYFELFVLHSGSLVFYGHLKRPTQ